MRLAPTLLESLLALGLAWPLAQAAEPTGTLAVFLTSTPPASQPAYRMKLIKVFDREGWDHPVEAYRILIPSDWQAEGWTRWRAGSIGCPDNIIDAGFRAVAPDGVTGIEIFPPFSWQWVQDSALRQGLQQQQEMNVRMLGPNARGCPMISAMTAADVLRTVIIPQHRPGAQIGPVEMSPELAKAAQAQVAQGLDPLLKAGLLAGYHVDAAKIHLLTSVHGKQAEETVSATVTVVQQLLPSMGAMLQGRPGQSSLYGMSGSNLIATRAPKGSLEASQPLFAAIVASLRPNFVWMNAIQQVIINMKNVQSKGAADRAAIWRKAQQEISQIHEQAFQHHQAVNDRLAKQFDQTIRGVQTFVDPNTKESVELTSGYKQYWTNGSGEYILSDDANFRPGGNWRLLESGK